MLLCFECRSAIVIGKSMRVKGGGGGGGYHNLFIVIDIAVEVVIVRFNDLLHFVAGTYRACLLSDLLDRWEENEVR